MAAPWGTVKGCSWSGVERILLSTHGVRDDEVNEMAGRVCIAWCRRVCAPNGMLDRVDRYGAARILRGEIVFGLPAHVLDDRCLVALPLLTVNPACQVVLHILHSCYELAVGYPLDCILIGNWFVLFGFHTPHIGITALCKAKHGSIDVPPNDSATQPRIGKGKKCRPWISSRLNGARRSP